MNSESVPEFRPEVLRYYAQGQEAARLETSFFRWEKIRTVDLLHRFLPPAPAVRPAQISSTLQWKSGGLRQVSASNDLYKRLSISSKICPEKGATQ